MAQNAYTQYQQLDNFTQARIRKEFPQRARQILDRNGLQEFQIENCLRFVKTTPAGGQRILSTNLILRDVMKEVLGGQHGQ